MEPIILCISGYRKFYNYTLFKNCVDKFIATNGIPEMIIFGDCSGVDKMALRYVQTPEHNIKKYKIFYANWDKYGLSAGPLRNKEMIDISTHLLAFLNNKSKGTKNTIELAKQKKINIEIIQV